MMRFRATFVLFLWTSSCAILSSPYKTTHDIPTLRLAIPRTLPSGVSIQLTSKNLRETNQILIYKALESEDYVLWKTIKVENIKESLKRGIQIRDSKIEYGQKVFYTATCKTPEKEWRSEEISIRRSKGPKAAIDLKAEIVMNAVRLSWSGPHLAVIYRRNVVEDSPLRVVSGVIERGHWTDTEVSSGVYSYQIAFARAENEVLVFGPLSEPIYLTFEP